ncbi:flagellar basal body-associated FliL family protein [Isachenkonia alkalipeptolytica]|uniref:Flagellar protein FliL n=1 Tax=Isachenkonia alkalipeptolytica TaxID=2565777 RepID=A0AA43XKK2_9CLOT|nr:flagellar basal body-associated FliL family protein [Isachenkonia alkalipeptolytica]NBG87575.1 hypothetical protein [Isachenkonia alkalipeptolytica]
MNMKKMIILVTTGILLSVIFFGGIIYFTFLRSSDDNGEIETYQHTLGEFTANLGDTRNYFQGDIIVEVEDEDLIEAIEEKEIIIRDEILGILIGKGPEELLEPEGQKELKGEIVQAISSILDTEAVSDLYFSSYIIQ